MTKKKVLKRLDKWGGVWYNISTEGEIIPAEYIKERAPQ
jgi:hypothetical protein